MKKKVIIGIHGLGNKPPRRTLRRWWKLSICEGLSHIGHPKHFFKFEVVYWAHFMHSEPLNVKSKDKSDPLYVEYPYVRGRKKKVKFRPSKFKKIRAYVAEKALDAIFLKEHKFVSFDWFSDFIIRKKFQDLALYFDKANVGDNTPGLYAKRKIREELANTLRKHKNRDILLIAHSMGSIIAYDVLTEVASDVKIDTFITLGSPLGSPAVMKKMLAEMNAEENNDPESKKRLTTPENVEKSWLNFSDLNDNVALNYTLSDDFEPNSQGIGPKDVIVNNDYEYEGENNPHKSYGYLRTPEVAEVIHEFLAEERPSLGDILRDSWDWFVSRFSR